MHRAIWASLAAVLIGQGEARAACVQSGLAVLHSRPSVSAKKTWEALIYTPFRMKKWTPTWSRVADIDGKIHWIESRHLSGELTCASVKVKKTTLYQKTNEDYVPIANLPVVRTVSFKVLFEGPVWIHLEDAQGNTYWGKKSDYWMKHPEDLTQAGQTAPKPSKKTKPKAKAKR